MVLNWILLSPSIRAGTIGIHAIRLEEESVQTHGRCLAHNAEAFSSLSQARPDIMSL